MCSALRQSQVQISVDKKNIEWTISHPVLLSIHQVLLFGGSQYIIVLDNTPEMFYAKQVSAGYPFSSPVYTNGSLLHLSFFFLFQ